VPKFALKYLLMMTLAAGCGSGGDTVSVDESLPPEVQEAIEAGLDEIELPVSIEEEASLGLGKPTGELVRVTHIDYAQPASAEPKEGDCGDTSARKKANHKWTILPILFHIDLSSVTAGVDPLSAKAAVVNAFATWDNENHPKGVLFSEGTVETAVVKIRWASIDGPKKTLAYAQTTYEKKSRKAKKSVLTFDSKDIWRVYQSGSCASQGSDFDIENVGTHEVGHIIGLGHTSTARPNKSATMHPYQGPGETQKRTLTTGDKAGIASIYP
jgi:hypothetical protein